MNKTTAELNKYEWLLGEAVVKLRHNSGKGKSILKQLKIEEWNVVVRKTGHDTHAAGWIEVPPMILVSPTENPNDERRMWVLEKNDPDFIIVQDG